MPEDHRPRPRPINILNLPLWAVATVKNSFWYYRPRTRPLTRRRLAALIRPNLQRPIFVVGAARSGTTFLGECLARLHEVSYHHEPVATKAAARYVWEGRWTEDRCRRFYRRVFGWLMRLHLDADLRFAEKTPRNSPIMPFLADAFPDAQFIHIVRDGRDVAVSHAERPWLSERQQGRVVYEPGGYPMGPYPHFWVEPERRSEFETCGDVRRCIWAWRVFVEAAQASGTELSPGRHIEVRYESMVSRPAATGRELLEFLEVSNPESRADFLMAISAARPHSVGRWKSGLSASDLAEVTEEAGALLARLGYTGSEGAAGAPTSDE